MSRRVLSARAWKMRSTPCRKFELQPSSCMIVQIDPLGAELAGVFLKVCRVSGIGSR